MALTPRLDLRQSQTLVMTPQLQQAIKLLQLSNLELVAFVEQELERNPLLEREENEGPTDANAAEGEGTTSEGEAPGGGEAAPEAAGDPPVADAVPEAPMVDALPGQAQETPLDVDYDNTWNNDAAADGEGGYTDWSGRAGRTDFADDENGIEQSVAREVSLRDHLTGQLNMDVSDPGDRIIGAYLIEALDETGYLGADLPEIAATLGAPLARVEAVLARLQRF